MFELAVKNAEKIFKNSKLKDTMIFCEYLMKPKHNTLSYERVPKNNIILFDVSIGNKYLNRKEKEKFAKKYGLELVPLLWKGNGHEITMDLINKLLETKSILGKEKVEGIVFKNYSAFWEEGYQAGKLIMLKYVKEKFKERNAIEWKKNTKTGFMELLIKSLRTEARWEKAVQHLRDKGQLTRSPKDIGNIMKEIVRDIEEEEKENIKEELWKFFWKQIKRGVVKGVPEWYKRKLIEDVINDM